MNYYIGKPQIYLFMLVLILGEKAIFLISNSRGKGVCVVFGLFEDLKKWLSIIVVGDII